MVKQRLNTPLIIYADMQVAYGTDIKIEYSVMVHMLSLILSYIANMKVNCSATAPLR